MLIFLLLLDTPRERTEYELMYDQHYMMVYRASYSVLKDYHLSQDAAQIFFLKIAKKFKVIHSESVKVEKGYIYRIAVNTARDMLKKERDLLSKEDSFESEIIDEQNLIEDSIIQIEDHERTLLLLDEINPSYGEIIYLKYYEEMKNNEIGELLELTPNAVRVKLHRALNALRNIVEKEIGNNE